MKRVYRLVHSQARQLALEAVRESPEGFVVTISEPSRSLDQNAMLWPILDCFSKQRQWPVNGQMEWLSREEWKDILTAAFEQETSPRVAMGYGGGMVMLGRRTREYGKKKFSDFIEFLHSAAIELGVEVKK
jgi:hypothetical protein